MGFCFGVDVGDNGFRLLGNDESEPDLGRSGYLKLGRGCLSLMKKEQT